MPRLLGCQYPRRPHRAHVVTPTHLLAAADAYEARHRQQPHTPLAGLVIASRVAQVRAAAWMQAGAR